MLKLCHFSGHNHYYLAVLLFSSLGQFVPNFEPEPEVSVNSLTSNFDIYISNESMAQRVGPCYTVRSSSRPDGSYREGWELNLEVNMSNQISVTGDCGRHFLTKRGVSIENLFNGFNSEVRMSSIYYFEVECTLSFDIFLLSLIS
jgi:hypothetical protein